MRRAELLAGVAAASLLAAAAPAPATSLTPPEIRNGLVAADGRVWFCQGDTLTVLDLANGRVLVRDLRNRCLGGLHSTPWGVLDVGNTYLRLIDPAATPAGGVMTSVWTQRCVNGGLIRDGAFLCPTFQDDDGKVILTILEKRSLEDDRLLWSANVPGQAHARFERDGRLLVESLTHGSPTHLSVLEWSTGRLLHQAEVPHADNMSVYGFDGSSVEMESSSNLPPGCSGRRTRRLTWDAEGRVTTSDGCGPYVRERFGRREQDEAGEITLSFTTERGGERIEASGPRGRWSAFTRGRTARRQRVYQAPGSVLLESADKVARVVWLECLDGETGRPRWIYGFPFYSAGPVDPSHHPAGTVPIDDAARLPLDVPYPAPVVLDPAPLPRAVFRSVVPGSRW